MKDSILYIINLGDIDQTSWILTCSETTPSTINGVVGPFQLVKHGTHRPQASKDVNMHGRV
jgi:hypothetical protein